MLKIRKACKEDLSHRGVSNSTIIRSWALCMIRVDSGRSSSMPSPGIVGHRLPILPILVERTGSSF